MISYLSNRIFAVQPSGGVIFPARDGEVSKSVPKTIKKKNFFGDENKVFCIQNADCVQLFFTLFFALETSVSIVFQSRLITG